MLVTFIFTCFFMTHGLGKHVRVNHNALEHDLSALLLTKLALGRRQQSTSSIVVALKMDKVRRFDQSWCVA